MSFPRGSNKGGVAPMVAQAPVKMNSDVDWVSIGQRRNTDPAKCLHPPMDLPNEHNDQVYQAWDGDIAFTRMSLANDAGRVTPGTRSSRTAQRAGGMNEDIAIPMDTTLNGIEAASPGELEDEIVPFGVVENPGNRDNGASRFNTVSGGGVTRINDCTHAVAAGDYAIVSVPDDKLKAANSRANIPSNARIQNQVGQQGSRLLGYPVGGADGQGKAMPHGRVALFLDKFTPDMVNLYDLTTYKRLIDGVPVTSNPRAQNLRESKNIQHGYVRALVEMLQAALLIAGPGGLGLTALTDAALRNQADYDDLLERNLETFMAAVDAGTLTDATLKVANQQMMHHHSDLSLRIHRRVIGRWLVGAPSGHDGYLQIGNYQY